jgi:nucleoside-diphosphate kinase
MPFRRIAISWAPPDPKKAAKGTIRADFAQSIDANAVHGSDGVDTAQTEIAYFFPSLNIYSR